MKLENIHFACMGNGVTAYDIGREISGDYNTVAHIEPDGSIEWYMKRYPADVKQKIIDMAEAEAKRYRENKEREAEILAERRQLGWKDAAVF